MITLGTTSGDYNVKYTLRKQAGNFINVRNNQAYYTVWTMTEITI